MQQLAQSGDPVLIRLLFELANLQELRFLDLSNNQLKAVPNCVQYFKDISKIDLSNNQISHLPKDFSVQFQQSTQLILAGNPIDKKEQEQIKQKYPNIHITF